MDTEIRQEVDDLIESMLDEYINRLGATEYTLMALGMCMESIHLSQRAMLGMGLGSGIEMLVPRFLVKGITQEEPLDLQSHAMQLATALAFASDYYHLRDLIYYSYAIPESIIWKKEGRRITVEVNDPTIFRQITCEYQTCFLNSKSREGDNSSYQETVDKLRGTQRWDLANPTVNAVLESIEQETDWKLSFNSDIPPDSSLDMGGYSYRDFYVVHRQMVIHSLYERYYSAATNDPCAITYYDHEILPAFSKELGIPQESLGNILRDIATASRGTMIRIEDKGKFIVYPHNFTLREGLSAGLKQFAKKDSNAFLTNFASPIGEALVTRVAACFTQYRNFRVLTDVNLGHFDPSLPDIDVMAVSYEPSLGFHFFICEIKNNLTATWAKDHLKAIGDKGYLTKALSQIERLKTFLGAEIGQQFLHDVAVELFSHLQLQAIFPTGFMVVVDFAIITAQSIGMFFPHSQVTIINEDLFKMFVKYSDGDVNYIQACLRHINERLDESYKKIIDNLIIGDVEIAFDVSSLEHSINFVPNRYLSDNALEELEKTALAEGYSFINEFVKPETREERPLDDDVLPPDEHTS